MRRFFCGFLLLVMVAGIVLTTGCLGGSGGSGVGAILGGAILLTALFSGGATASTLAFAASDRTKPAAAIFAGTTARKYQTRVTIGGKNIPITGEATISNGSKTIELTTTLPDLSAGKQQVLVELLPASSTTGEALLKAYINPTVTDGQTTPATAEVTLETTAKALIYDKWDGRSTTQFDSFQPNVASVTAIRDLLEVAIAPNGTFTTNVDYQVPTQIQQKAASAAAEVPYSGSGTGTDTATITTAQAAYDAFMPVYFKALSGTKPSASEISSVSAILADDFVHMGYNKTAFLNLLGNPTNQGFSIAIKNTGTIETASVGTGLDKAIRGYTLTFTDGTNAPHDSITQTAANSFTPNSAFTTFSNPTFNSTGLTTLFLRKLSNGSYQILGNQMKCSWMDTTLSFSHAGGSGVNENHVYNWVSLTPGPSFPVTSVAVSGNCITGTMNLQNTGEEWSPKSTDWNIRHIVGTTAPVTPLTVTVTYQDNSAQTFQCQPNDTAGMAALQNVVVTPVSGAIQVSWAKSTDTDFTGYWIGLDNSAGSQVYSYDIYDINQTSITIPTTANGITAGSNARVEIDAGNRRGFERGYGYWFTAQ